MKKYYLLDTEEEVFVDDVVKVPFEKKFDNGITLKRDEEFKVTEDSIPFLLDMGILEEEDVDEEEDDLVDFDDEPCKHLVELIERVEKLEDKVKTLKDMTEHIYNEGFITNSEWKKGIQEIMKTVYRIEDKIDGGAKKEAPKKK